MANTTLTWILVESLVWSLPPLESFDLDVYARMNSTDALAMTMSFNRWVWLGFNGVIRSSTMKSDWWTTSSTLGASFIGFTISSMYADIGPMIHEESSLIYIHVVSSASLQVKPTLTRHDILPTEKHTNFWYALILDDSLCCICWIVTPRLERYGTSLLLSAYGVSRLIFRLQVFGNTWPCVYGSRGIHLLSHVRLVVMWKLVCSFVRKVHGRALGDLRREASVVCRPCLSVQHFR